METITTYSMFQQKKKVGWIFIFFHEKKKSSENP